MNTETVKTDNASQRHSYAGYIYNIGADKFKETTLQNLNKTHADLHKSGKIHIHDLDAYGITYNCLQVDILQSFPFDILEKYSDTKKIMSIISHYQNLVMKLGHEQSGGIGFPNFDEEISFIFDKLNISINTVNLEILKNSIELFIDWVSKSHERLGQFSFYVTLNLGLSTTKIGRLTTKYILSYFKNSQSEIIRPNIIFKVKKGVNYYSKDENFDLYNLAISSTIKKMIPTYILFDSQSNKDYDPKKVAIMGCRTKVVNDLYGEKQSVGRGNIDYISINLPRIALEIDKNHPDKNTNEKYIILKKEWKIIADETKQILLDRYNKLIKLPPENFHTNWNYKLWIKDLKKVSSMEEIFKHGTLSIGFIGLSETIEIITGDKIHKSQKSYDFALNFVKYMRKITDEYAKKEKLNFTLLASSGELISGRFPELDKKLFNHKILAKKYYTNSFHIEVDAGINPIEKVKLEGPFHIEANGGCITYVEFKSSPLNNSEAIKEIIDAGINSGTNYLGFNYPLDVCKKCNETGTFDICPKCGSSEITRIRRVSGYLEELDSFVAGKKEEVSNRKPNFCINTRNQ